MPSDVGRDASLAGFSGEAVLIVVFVGVFGQSASTRSSVQHRQRRIDFGSAACVRGLGIDHQGVPMVGQDMAEVPQPGGVAPGLLIQSGVGIGLAFLSIRAPWFALEGGRSLRRLVVIILTTIADLRRSGGDQRAVHTEMLFGQQSALAGLVGHRIQQPAPSMKRWRFLMDVVAPSLNRRMTARRTSQRACCSAAV